MGSLQTPTCLEVFKYLDAYLAKNIGD